MKHFSDIRIVGLVADDYRIGICHPEKLQQIVFEPMPMAGKVAEKGIPVIFEIEKYRRAWILGEKVIIFGFRGEDGDEGMSFQTQKEILCVPAKAAQSILRHPGIEKRDLCFERFC